MHKYNNRHSMYTAMRRSKTFSARTMDIWAVNVEEEYHERTPMTGRGPKGPFAGGTGRDHPCCPPDHPPASDRRGRGPCRGRPGDRPGVRAGDLGPPARALHRRRNNGPARRRAVVGSFVCAAGATCWCRSWCGGTSGRRIRAHSHVWMRGPGPCSPGFSEWPATAIDHGANLFFSTALFHPSGFNLLANTSVLAIGVPLARSPGPSPIANLERRLHPVPVATALSAFWLLRRWVRWTAGRLSGRPLVRNSHPLCSRAGRRPPDDRALAVLPLMPAVSRTADPSSAPGHPRRGALGLLVCVEFFRQHRWCCHRGLASVIGVVL